MSTPSFDQYGRYLIDDYSSRRPFSSFLPGIAGHMGIPMWVFYVNRGQAITSFGVESKDRAMMEFQPANKAYQLTATTGFRTFLKLRRGALARHYEPFAVQNGGDGALRQMAIGLNELALQEINTQQGLITQVLYFTLPGEDFAGLVRRVTITNSGEAPWDLELLDGMPLVVPYGVSDHDLKAMGRTIEAWMEVFNLDGRLPFYRVRASTGDTTQVQAVTAGHFAMAFLEGEAEPELLSPLVDPALVFGQETSLLIPRGFQQTPLAALLQARQITGSRTPCAFFPVMTRLAPGQSLTLTSIFGHSGSLSALQARHERLLSSSVIEGKHRQAQALARSLTDKIATSTASPVFDAYCRQTFLDNVLRGGWPVVLGEPSSSHVYHIYSRKHGDPERDYNAFFLAAEPYSQGNGNYRDINQNRRCDVLFEPRVVDFNVRSFLSLIQSDGYNPLVVRGSTFVLPEEQRAQLAAATGLPAALEKLLQGPFTPGQLLKAVADQDIELGMTPEQLLALVLSHAQQQVEATFGEGYWVDHWTYNLDQVESYLAVWPDRRQSLLFGQPGLPFFDSPAIVLPREQRYVLVDGQPHQLHAVVEDEAKAHLIASRDSMASWARTGQGEIFRATVFEKLLLLALLKLATMDPLGMGIEMEAGKPGWYDALNGLPGLFGSSMPETYELLRLLRFLAGSLEESDQEVIHLPAEAHDLLQAVLDQIKIHRGSFDSRRDFNCWDAVATARETYRERTRLGFDGDTCPISAAELTAALILMQEKVRAGIAQASGMNGGLPPTYFAWRAEEFKVLGGADGEPKCDAEGRPFVWPQKFTPQILPPFLEGAVRAMKVQPNQAAARRLHGRVKDSALFDRQLGMFKVNASLAGQSHQIGRARAFTPGWLENESIWLHMAYKYLLGLLQAGLVEEFYQELPASLIAFQDPEVYGRSPTENSSFIVSSAHPDSSLHGAGFVARLSGSTAEFLSMWCHMMAGPQPFTMRDGQLVLALQPVLPGWLFDESGELSFTFLGQCQVRYTNANRRHTYDREIQVRRTILHLASGEQVALSGAEVGPPHSAMVRDGRVTRMDVTLG